MSMESAINRVLALWREGLITRSEVVAWADRMILLSDEIDEAISELSLKGPERYWELPRADFPHPEALSFLESFSVRASVLNTSSYSELRHFTDWLCSACIGEDLNLSEVKFGYYAFQFLEMDDPQGATAHVRQHLPEFLPACKDRAARYWSAYTQAQSDAASSSLREK